MIDQADERMLEWARAVVPDVPVEIAPPPAPESGAGVRLHLLSIHPVAALRGLKRPPHELALRYLVTTAAADEAEAHRWLGALAFAAMEVAEWSFEREPLPVELWRAFGIAPRPAFLISVPLRLDRPVKQAPPVRKPPVVRSTPIAALAGVVIGPGDLPIADATIEVPALQLYARSAGDGSFRFPTVPATSAVSLVVRARRHSRSVRARPGEALLIRFDDLEG